MTALQLATINGRESLVQLILVHMADTNAKADRGFTPLDLAASDWGKRIVDYFHLADSMY